MLVAAHALFLRVEVPSCDSGDRLRLICMGKGFLTPDSRTLSDCEVPVFTTHATPINVSVKPTASPVMSSHPSKGGRGSTNNETTAVAQGCGCIIQ